MAIKKVIEIDVDVLNANGGLDNLQNSFKEVETSTKSLKQQLKEAVVEVQKLSEQYGETSKEAINAAKRAAELKDRIEDTNDAIQAFKGEGTFIATSKALAGVASGFGAVQGAMSLLGTENKDLQEQLLKVQSAMALADGLAGLEDTGRAFKQLGAVVKSNAVIQGLYATAVGVSTGAMKLFRLALVATGVGALVVGIGLLIANFDKVKTAVTNFLPGLASAGKAIEAIITSITDFVGITSEADRQIEIAKEKAKQQLELNKKYLQEHESQLNEVTKKKIEAKNKYLAVVAEEGKATAEFAKETNRQLSKIDKEAQDEKDKKAKEAFEKQSELQKKADAEAKEKRDKARKDERESMNASAKELQETRDKIEAERQKREAELKAKAKEIQDKLAEDAKPEMSEREMLEAKYQQEYDILVAANESTLALSAKHSADLLAITDKEAEAKRQADEKVLNDKKILRQQELAMTSETFGKVAEILGKNSKVGKAFAVSQALINTYQGITAELATKAITPFEIGLKVANVAYIATTGFKAVKSIMSTSTSSGGGGAPSGGGGAQAPSFNVVGNSGVNQIAQTLGQQQQNPIQAVVVANNVTTAQSANRNIVQNASLG